jgi:hypothetical protein
VRTNVDALTDNVAGEVWTPIPGRRVFDLPDPRRHRWDRGSFRPTLILSLCCAALIALSLWSIRQEATVNQYQAQLDQAAVAPPVALSGIDLPPFAPARIYLAQALYIAQAVAASDDDGPNRAALLSQARQYLLHIENVRPHWGELWIVRAYIESLSTGRFTTTERDALVRSYLDAPYVHDAGRWRATRALAHWSAFPRFAQNRIAEETAWLIRTSSVDARENLLTAAQDSEGYAEVEAALERIPS